MNRGVVLSCMNTDTDRDRDTSYVWNAYEVGNGDLVVCEEGNAEGWLRSDTVVPLVDAGADQREDHQPAPE
jgi:hypothetical protein